MFLFSIDGCNEKNVSTNAEVDGSETYETLSLPAIKHEKQ